MSINTDNAPWVVQWLEWCLLNYLDDLPLCIAVVLALKWWDERHYLVSPALIEWPTIQLTLFAGCCLWVVVCVVRQGHGLG